MTLVGTVIDFNPVLASTPADKELKVVGRSIEVRKLQYQKPKLPILVKLVGRSIVVNEQFRNAPFAFESSPITSIFEYITTLVIVQSSNAPFSILVTPESVVISMSPLQQSVEGLLLVIQPVVVPSTTNFSFCDKRLAMNMSNSDILMEFENNKLEFVVLSFDV